MNATRGQRVKVFQVLVTVVVVNAIFLSGSQLTKEAKEKAAFVGFEAELSHFISKTGRWAVVTEYFANEFTKEELRAATGKTDLNSSKIWEKGMAGRRDLVSWISLYGAVLNFTVIRPLVDENDASGANREHFDLELNEDSGGNEDAELSKLHRKVTSHVLSSLIVTKI
jgi:hypothetical protein